ncbi:pyridoxamine 5'-phosphate oxidase family protein [Pedobacter sp. MC2016-15]|uniref:pyridoxamine 5'-phosphate oxidase family protein n=1 Tax=Pedobacter sp. MC2016-15 TaxID=2994473 RepID=UPI002247F6CE|nr:pyridoxamine 5'-phosphate oxidase family protein [Pedobacter sp. MC2016-15]MCX2477467.1 pyridoxamine 5'-phosphate oxidase family protein [Pedobacter sp. MC2016-15]
MDSINQNQTEENHKNLDSAAAVKKIKELVDIAKTCFLCTKPSAGDSNGTRPMNVQEVDEQGTLWFLIANDSHTYQDISANSGVKLYFQGSSHSDFLFLEGTAILSADKAKIKDLWNPIMKTWFTEGEDDPRIAVLKISSETGYYWDNKHGNVVAGIKTVIGAAIGKTLDDSIEGDINV